MEQQRQRSDDALGLTARVRLLLLPTGAVPPLAAERTTLRGLKLPLPSRRWPRMATTRVIFSRGHETVQNGA